ncbi:MAG: pentapeptide repeat-containing protein, partial [Limnothrix sp.]|nr:pentapeptide repeat-containing protein [Limnothrix sp.]
MAKITAHQSLRNPDRLARLGAIGGMALGIGLAIGLPLAPAAQVSAARPNLDPLAQLRAFNHCRGCDLRYRDLTSLNLQDADLRSANLYGANL